MKKVGIITLLGYNNYGNRLQNYAVYDGWKRSAMYFIKDLKQMRNSVLRP